MASVWKRLQRVNKRAAKLQYTASYHSIELHLNSDWRPNKLSVVWTRRSRRVVTPPVDWEPSLKDPLKGSVIFPVPENQTIAVTLFKDSRTNELEDKEWTFLLEDVCKRGKRRRLASYALNLRPLASLEPTQHNLTIALQPTSRKVQAASIQLTLHCVLLREGRALDDDMQSLASLLSVNTNSDIAPLEELEDDDISFSENSASIQQMLDYTQQLERLTSSLTSAELATPNSLPSLDATPTSPLPPPAPAATAQPQQHAAPAPHTPHTPPDDKPEWRGVVLRARQVSKHNLKPLELKCNLNESMSCETQEEDDITPVPGTTPHATDKTPVQDLLEWCQEATKEYRCCRVTNLTTSFRNGLALCSIIHRYRPDLIDFSALEPEDAAGNVRAALEASAALGVSQVLTARELLRDPAPDRLAIMTHLFQLRAHFTGNELHVEQLGSNPAESSYLVGRHDTDSELADSLFSQEILTRNKTHQPPLKWQSSTESEGRPERAERARSTLLTHSRHLLDRLMSPNKEKPPAAAAAAAAAKGDGERESGNTRWFQDPLGAADLNSEPTRPVELMSRRQLLDPFASDEEDDTPTPNTPVTSKSEEQSASTDSQPSADNTDASAPDLPRPAPQLLSRHDELKERARQLLEATKREARAKGTDDHAHTDTLTNGHASPDKMSEEARQAALRERARQLIADARAGVVSPTSPLSPGRRARAPAPTLEIIRHTPPHTEAEVESLRKERSPSRRDSAEPAEAYRLAGEGEGAGSGGDSTPASLQSFSALVDRLTDTSLNQEGEETGSYICSEMEALEREQSAIDEQAAALERQLRAVMESSNNTEEEDRLMCKWFTLVNKKNALLRRQMQLNILEQEEDLSRRCELLARELRQSQGVEEWRKSDAQRNRERLLLHELLRSVNERDRLVREMDSQERAIEDDDEIERNLSHVEIQRKNNCALQ